MKIVDYVRFCDCLQCHGRRRIEKRKVFSAQDCEESRAAFWKWFHKNYKLIDVRQRANLERYVVNNPHIKRVAMLEDSRGMLLRLFMNPQFWYRRELRMIDHFSPSFCIVRDATVKTRLHALMVPSYIRSCTQGLAWTIGLTTKEYEKVRIEA